MKNNACQVQVGDWSSLEAALRPIRTTVFIEEQNVPEDLEWDEDDATAWHLLATDSQPLNSPASASPPSDGPPAVGCARLLPSGQIGRMAVVIAHRGRGIGSCLLAEAEATARKNGMKRVFLHAQTHAIPFYAHHGYQVCSEEFLDAGIPHKTMEKSLTPTS